MAASSRSIGGAIALFLIGLLFPSVSHGEAEALPRYKFEVGQELVYAGSSDFKHESGSFQTTDRTTLWVTRKNKDGSWHIVAYAENTFTQQSGGQTTPYTDKRTSLGEFDIRADGAVSNLPEGLDGMAITSSVFKLPESAEQLTSGWKVESDGGTECALYRDVSRSLSKQGDFVIERQDAGLFSKIYLSKKRSRIHFDAARGLVSRIEIESSQGSGFRGIGSGVGELKSSEIKDPQWMEQFGREIGSVLKIRELVFGAASDRPSNLRVEERVLAAEKLLVTASSEVKLPLAVALLDEQRDLLERVKVERHSGQQREDLVLNKPAADWETTDIDGGKHTLAGYRGKVVVLDFWYRGCGFCVKAMPQIMEVVVHYRKEPVAILGMNTDVVEKDARFVMDTLKLNYPTLKGKGLPEKYGVQGFPTMVVIDRKGIVRKLHVGYSPTLRQQMIDTIDGLLREPN